MFTTAFNSSSSDHIKADAVSNADRMSCCHVIDLHIGNDLNNLFRIAHLSISEQNDMPNIVFHGFLNLDDAHERLCYFCASEVSIKAFNETDCFL